MSARIFLSQSAIERFAAEGRCELDATSFAPLAGPLAGTRLAIEPAVRVLRSAEGGDDRSLAGRVKRVEDLRALGAEQLGTSMLVGDAAYDVEPGFLATLDEATARLLAPPAVEGTSEAANPIGQTDAEALARFLLNTLT